MFTSDKVNFKTAGVLSPLVLNYLNAEENLKNFYGFYPDLNGFRNFLNTNPYSSFNYQRLSEIALNQCGLVKNTSSQSLSNAKKLGNKNVFTVTTGHQLCLFTGPLYFIYKIFSAINLAEKLKSEFPDHDFVPVYWMASEDHDFAEINNFNLFGKNIKWESTQTGAVGSFKTGELNTLAEQLEQVLGSGENAAYLSSLFKNAYLHHSDLASATRYMVNELFGEYGLLVIDGNDREFKKQFAEEFKKDIFENIAFNCVTSSIEKLKSIGYEAQVNPRSINCFYLEEGKRSRIEKSGENYGLVGSDVTFSKSELENLLENEILRFSPNVVLRPLYQQVILPNIAYVGGPGELAYWLELKEMFNSFNIQLPILVPRSFLVVADKTTQTKINKLNFSVTDFFKTEDELIKEFQVNSNAVFSLNNEKEKITELFNQITGKINQIDKSLTASVMAEMQKSYNSLDLITGKANKALKQKSETEINQIKNIKSKLFPEGTPQERYDNFSAFYFKYGKQFFSALKKHLHPLDFEQKILLEE